MFFAGTVHQILRTNFANSYHLLLVLAIGCSAHPPPSVEKAGNSDTTSSSNVAGSSITVPNSADPSAPPAAPHPDAAPPAPANDDRPKVSGHEAFWMPKTTEASLSGLKYWVETEGTGPTPQSGHKVYVHYTGYLTNGTKFDSSKSSPGGSPFGFTIDKGQVIDGWDEGIMKMKVGGKMWLVIPPLLAYGEAGSPPVIPPDATLVFYVELLRVE